MPFYKYICDKCEKQHTVMKKVADYDREEHCPDCNDVMNRDPKDIVCGYANDKDFFGKSLK